MNSRTDLSATDIDADLLVSATDLVMERWMADPAMVDEYSGVFGDEEYLLISHAVAARDANLVLCRYRIALRRVMRDNARAEALQQIERERRDDEDEAVLARAGV